jgi:hypothetical protein
VKLPVVQQENPLTQNDLAILLKCREIAARNIDYAKKLTECGINCADHEARNQMHLDVADKLIKSHFPGMTSFGDPDNVGAS